MILAASTYALTLSQRMGERRTHEELLDVVIAHNALEQLDNAARQLKQRWLDAPSPPKEQLDKLEEILRLIKKLRRDVRRQLTLTSTQLQEKP